MKRFDLLKTAGAVLLLTLALTSCGSNPPEGSTTASPTSSEPTTPAVTTQNVPTPSTEQTTKPTPTVGTTAAPRPTTAGQESSVPPVTDNPSTPGTTVPKPPATTKPQTTPKPTVTTVKVPDKDPNLGKSFSIRYSVNNPKAGSLSGSTSQTIRYGSTTTSTVTAKPALGYKFVSWSDGVKSASRGGESFSSNRNLVANFEFDALELPIISLTTENEAMITSKVNYINGTISVLNTDKQYQIDNLAMQIRGRGNYTWSSQIGLGLNGKVPYRIKLSEKQNLLGEGDGPAKVWTLLADHCDQALLRNYTALNFTKKMSAIAWNSAARSVEVYLNGEYRGVFLLCEQNQVNKFRVNINDDIEAAADQRGYLIELSGYAEDPYFIVSGTKYEVKSDLSTNAFLFDSQLSYIEDYVWQCWQAAESGSEARCNQLIDIDSVIDTYLIEELFKNLDAGWDSFYLYKDKGGKLTFGPIWDFDQSGGNADEGCENYYDLRGGNTNCWFRTFLRQSWFKEKLTARWNSLKKEIDTIPSMIRTQAQAGYSSYCRNFDRWQIFGQKINRETAVIRALKSYKEHYEYYANWMKNRIDWLDEYWNAPSFNFSGKLTLSGNGTASNPYKVTSAADFLNFTACLLSGQTFERKYFVQTADIDMSTVKGYNGAGASALFAGIYDGRGHSITVSISATDSSIFPYLKGKVYNVVAKGKIQNSGISAGLCRSVRSGGVLANCISLVDVISTGGNAGGITASNQNGSVIAGCYFGGTLQAQGSTGPINVWYADRPGNFELLYYVQGLPNSTADVPLERDETSVAASAAGAKSAVTAMNNGLSKIASASGVSKSTLCEWVVEGSKPKLKASS